MRDRSIMKLSEHGIASAGIWVGGTYIAFAIAHRYRRRASTRTRKSAGISRAHAMARKRWHIARIAGNIGGHMGSNSRGMGGCALSRRRSLRACASLAAALHLLRRACRLVLLLLHALGAVKTAAASPSHTPYMRFARGVRARHWYTTAC